MSKKYKNLINAPEIVRVPKWEYQALIRNATILEIMETLMANGEKYKAADIMGAIYKSDGKEIET